MLPLTPVLRQQAERISARLDANLAPYSAQEECVFAGSEFVAQLCICHPDWLQALRNQPPQPDEWQNYAPRLADAMAGVTQEDRKALLGHKNGSITSHYSGAELGHLIEAANMVSATDSRGPVLTILKRRTG